MRQRGFILQPTYRIEGGRPVVHLYGRLESGRSFLVRETRRAPRFYVRETDAAAARALGAAPLTPAGRHTFTGESVALVEVAVPADAPPLRDRLQGAGIPCYEADVRFAMRALMDRGIRGSLEIEGVPRALNRAMRTPDDPEPAPEGRAAAARSDPKRAAPVVEPCPGPVEGPDPERTKTLEPAPAAGDGREAHADLPQGLLVFDDPVIRPADWTPRLSVLALDIETDPDARRLLSISLYGCGASEVLLLTPPGSSCPHGALPFPNERDLLRAFCLRVRELDPDVLTGWNVVDFDLAVLVRLAGRLGIVLDPGRAPGPVRVQPARSVWGSSQASVPGRAVLDGIALLRGAFIRMEDHSLDAVARSVLGEGKTLSGRGRAEAILEMFEHDRERFALYNLTDSRLALEIVEKLRLVELAVERSRLTGMPPDRVAASIASFDFLYLSELGRRGIVAPTVGGVPEGRRPSGSRAPAVSKGAQRDLPEPPETPEKEPLLGEDAAQREGAGNGTAGVEARDDVAPAGQGVLRSPGADPGAGRATSHARARGPGPARDEAEESAWEPTMGGYVLEPEPGLYRNVLLFDFKSLYPSLIRTFQIDPLGFLPRSREDEPLRRAAIVAPNGAAFRREPGILPGLLDDLFPRREAAKRSGDAVASNAIKILMNSFYGVLGTPACRFHSPDIANAITSFGREMLLWSKGRIEAYGRRVLYGDTDSLFVLSGTGDAAAARALGEGLVRDLNRDLHEHVRGTWHVESRLELEYEDLYLRLLLPHVRGGSTGARKRYAGLVEKSGARRVVFTGLEVVRRDWTDLAREVQRELYERLFSDRPVEEYLRSVVADLRQGRLDDKLVYRKALRKDLEAYTTSTPPHVAAARKMSGAVGRLVAYVVTSAGPEPAGEARSPIDHEHYVQKQIRPVAEPVLEVLGGDFARIAGDDRQLELF